MPHNLRFSLHRSAIPHLLPQTLSTSESAATRRTLDRSWIISRLKAVPTLDHYPKGYIHCHVGKSRGSSANPERVTIRDPVLMERRTD